MQTLCANTSALNAYLREQDRAEKRERWIELEAAVKYAEMQPLSRGDIDEALAEVMNDRAKAGVIASAFAGSDDADLGKAIRSAVKDYWMGYCTQKAADDYDDGAADPDYGRY